MHGPMGRATLTEFKALEKENARLSEMKSFEKANERLKRVVTDFGIGQAHPQGKS